MSNFKFKKLACVLSSMLILASVPYSVSSMEPGNNQSVSNLKSRILGAFEGEPCSWEPLRGDLSFWSYLREYFSKMEIDEGYTSRDFENEICRVFEQISGGQKLEYGKKVFVKYLVDDSVPFLPEYVRPTGGQVSGSWWIEEGIPYLKNRIFGINYLEVLSIPYSFNLQWLLGIFPLFSVLGAGKNKD